MNIIRFAREEDAKSLLDIYSYYVESTSVSFETVVPTEEEFSERIRSISETYPYVVCEAEGRIVGYAYAHRYAERAAYCYDVEVSVYVHESFHSKGVAKRLYDTVFELLYHQGFYNAYAGVTVPNEKSHRFHEKYGFEQIGIFPDAGFKLGEWHGVEWFAKKIKPLDQKPGEIKPIGELENELIDEILKRHN